MRDIATIDSEPRRAALLDERHELTKLTAQWSSDKGFCNQPLLMVPIGSPIPHVAEPFRAPQRSLIFVNSQ